jgi:hypothetical protein
MRRSARCCPIFQLLPVVEEALRADASLWNVYHGLPPLYQRIRVGYIQEQRANTEEFERRLRNFVHRTARGELFGNWTDDGRLTASDTAETPSPPAAARLDPRQPPRV